MKVNRSCQGQDEDLMNGSENPGMLLNQAISEKQLLQGEFRSPELKIAFDVDSRGSVFCIEFKCSQLHKTSELLAPLGNLHVH